MRQLLEAPVQVGDVQLAPTTELAGLAELAAAADHDAQLVVLARVAASIAEEDVERDRIADLRRAERPQTPLPRRR